MNDCGELSSLLQAIPHPRPAEKRDLRRSVARGKKQHDYTAIYLHATRLCADRSSALRNGKDSNEQ